MIPEASQTTPKQGRVSRGEQPRMSRAQFHVGRCIRWCAPRNKIRHIWRVKYVGTEGCRLALCDSKGVEVDHPWKVVSWEALADAFPAC